MRLKLGKSIVGIPHVLMSHLANKVPSGVQLGRNVDASLSKWGIMAMHGDPTKG